MLRLAEREQSVATIVLRVGLVVHNDWLAQSFLFLLLGLSSIRLEASGGIL